MPELCESEKAWNSAAHTTFSFFLELTLLLVWAPFAMKFAYDLLSLKERTPIVWAVIVYELAVAIFVCGKLWLFGIEPIVQSHQGFSQNGCAFLEYVTITSGLFYFTAITQVFIHRLKISFRGSKFDVHPWQVRLFQCANVSLYLFVLTVLTVSFSRIDCSYTSRSGIMHGLGLAGPTYQVCDLPRTSLDRAAIYSMSTLTLILNSCLTYMFTVRLRQLEERSSDRRMSVGSRNEDAAMRLLIEKTVLMQVLSMITFVVCVVLTATLQFSGMMTVDACLNSLFLFCMMSMGDRLYFALFHRLAVPFRMVFLGINPEMTEDDTTTDPELSLPSKVMKTVLSKVHSNSINYSRPSNIKPSVQSSHPMTE